MRREGLKRLELWLPVDHWIWSLPKKSRAVVAKRWLELKAPTKALQDKLIVLEEAVARIEQKLGEPPKEEQKHKREESKREKKVPAIDPEAFFRI